MRAFVTKPSVRPAGSVRVARLAPCAASATEKAAASLPKFDGPDVNPSTAEIEGILSTLVHDTDIMEMDLEMGGFKLHVKRSTGGAAADATPVTAVAAHAPAPAAPAPAAAAASRPSASEAPEFEATMDESLLAVQAPKVGIFRRGKYAGNKRVGKGNCVEAGDAVKKGQAVGFVEQLGTFVPVEAPQAGELVKFDVQDGDAVEYLQAIVHVAPFFGGHIIGEAKHA